MTGFRHRRPHGLGAFLEFPSDAVGLNGRLMPVPGKTLHADSRDIAAKTSEALDKADADAGAGGGERGGQAARPRTHHQNIGRMDDLDLTGRFGNEGRLACHAQWSLGQMNGTSVNVAE